jgi:hypothetical protein
MSYNRKRSRLYRGQWCPPFENREGWGSRFWGSTKAGPAASRFSSDAKVGQPPYQSQTNNPLFNLWQLKCRKVHEQQHQADFESGKFPEVPSDFCKGKKNGLPVGVPKDAKPKIECSGYTAQMECLNQAPGALMDREKNDVKDKIKQYCCGSK